MRSRATFWESTAMCSRLDRSASVMLIQVGVIGSCGGALVDGAVAVVEGAAVVVDTSVPGGLVPAVVLVADELGSSLFATQSATS
jgi:hypothetical protein